MKERRNDGRGEGHVDDPGLRLHLHHLRPEANLSSAKPAIRDHQDQRVPRELRISRASISVVRFRGFSNAREFRTFQRVQLHFELVLSSRVNPQHSFRKLVSLFNYVYHVFVTCTIHYVPFVQQLFSWEL